MDATVVDHIALSERLEILFRKTNLKRDQMLAFLGRKSNGTVSNWFKRDEIPPRHLERICQFFGVDSHVLGCENRQQFMAFIQASEPTLGRRWESFIAIAKADSGKFGSVRLDSANRAIDDPSWLKEPGRMAEIQVLEAMRFRVTRDLLRGIPISRAHHVCIMAKDRLGWTLLSPDLVRDDLVPESWHRASSQHLELPTRQGGLRFSRNGIVEAYALVTRTAIPIEFIQQLADGPNFLLGAERVVRWIEASDMGYSLFRHEFLCFHGRRQLSQRQA